MREPNLLSKVLRRRAAHPKEPKRRWNCPSDATIAAYLDSALGETARVRLHDHFGGCEYCRALIADVVKLQRIAELPPAPAALVARARALVPTVHSRWAWGWPTVAAAGTLACAVIAVSVFRPPQTLDIPAWPSPKIPAISQSQPSAPANPSGREAVRKPKSPESSPSIIFPPPDKVTGHEPLQFRWLEVPGALYYQVRLLTSEGDLVWEGNSSGTRIELPSDLALRGGKYYVSVAAVMKDGRRQKSNPVSLQIANSQ
jgi:hypothetical protein